MMMVNNKILSILFIFIPPYFITKASTAVMIMAGIKV